MITLIIQVNYYLQFLSYTIKSANLFFVIHHYTPHNLNAHSNGRFLFSEEELQCLAQWKEGSHHYLVGKIRRGRGISLDEESYRCFVFEPTKGSRTGYNVGMSGDATCSGISSPQEGARRLTFTKGMERVYVVC